MEMLISGSATDAMFFARVRSASVPLTIRRASCTIALPASVKRGSLLDRSNSDSSSASSSDWIDWLTADKWEIEAGGFAPDGKSLTWTANVDGTTNIYSYDIASRHATALPIASGVNSIGGNPTAFIRDGARLLYSHNGANAPSDLWVYDSASKQSSQITHALVGGLRGSDMVSPYLVHYPSRDGKFTISAFAYVPNNIQRNGKFPAIVYIHGGPAVQSVDSFNRFIQYIVNQGYLVIAPNYRGSTG